MSLTPSVPLTSQRPSSVCPQIKKTEDLLSYYTTVYNCPSVILSFSTVIVASIRQIVLGYCEKFSRSESRSRSRSIGMMSVGHPCGCGNN